MLEAINWSDMNSCKFLSMIGKFSILLLLFFAFAWVHGPIAASAEYYFCRKISFSVHGLSIP